MKGKIDKMFGGVHINTTEDRSVLHCALRAPRNAVSEPPLLLLQPACLQRWCPTHAERASFTAC